MSTSSPSLQSHKNPQRQVGLALSTGQQFYAGHHTHQHCAHRKADLSSKSVFRLRCFGKQALQSSPNEDSRLLLQACVAALESPGLLVQVLNHLGCIKAVALCSTVNRSWQAASQQVQLHSVTLMPANEVLSSAEAKRDLKMCKKLGAQGMFNQLQSINMCAMKFSMKQVRRYSYVQSLLTIMSAPICKGISTSMLTSCQLSGMFNLISVVQCLPVSLQHLVLEPDHSNSNGSAIDLSMFGKFACLQTLEIDIQHFEVFKLCPSEFILDGPLPSLKSLYMLHHGRLLQDPAFMLSACLPSLRHVGAVIHLDCAQAFLDLPELEFAAFSLNAV